MFEKEATEYATVGQDKSSDPRNVFTPKIDEIKFNDWRNGAEYGYKIAHEEMDYLNHHYRENKDDDIVIIFQHDFCNMENHNPEEESILGYVNNDSEANEFINNLKKS